MDNLSKELTIDMITDGDNRTIAEAIGVENFYKLCEVVGGATIYLPKPESVLRPVRDAHIKAEFNGYNHPENTTSPSVGYGSFAETESSKGSLSSSTS